MITSGLFEQHFHGCFGIDFNKATVNEVIFLSRKVYELGITTIIPVIATDTLENMQRQIAIIQKAKEKNVECSAEIYGIHLEGPFLNPNKRGAHPINLLQKTSVKLFQKFLENPLIKIITLAPELDENNELVNYLKEKNIKISAGHCETHNLDKVNQVTHIFNAMNGLHHRNKSTTLSALVNDEIYTEIIADGEHVQDDMLKLFFKTKNKDKILLISDCAPSAKSDIEEFDFLGETIYLQGDKLVNKQGVIAGSAMMLNDIVKRLVLKNIITFDEAIKYSATNQKEYHDFDDNHKIEWDDNLNIKKVL